MASNTTISPAENQLPIKKARTFASVVCGPAPTLPLKTTKSRLARKSATTTKKPKISKGSTFQGGSDPFHAIIVAHGEPTHWTQMREFYSLYQEPHAMATIEPPDAQFYECFENSPATPVSSGLDVDRHGMGPEEFWGRLGEAFRRNIEGEDMRFVWSFGDEERRGIGSVLWEEREEEEEKELYAKMNEVESWGG